MTSTLVFYPLARTYHVARPPLPGTEHVRFLGASYDFDAEVSGRGRDVQLVSWHRLLRDAWRLAPDTVEVPEPLWLKYAPLSLLVALVAVVGRAARRRPRPTVVTYAIENNALDDRYLLFLTRVPRPLRRLAVRVLLLVAGRVVDRVVYGSEAAQQSYARARGRRWLDDELVVVETTDACTQCQASGPHPAAVTFVGELHERKGVDVLVAAWPAVRRARPDATLTLVGDGPLRPALQAAADASEGSLRLTGTLSSSEVADLLDATCVAVQVSQPHLRWREQIGLPIREAVKAGCRLVTTPETGLTPVLSPDPNASFVPVGCTPEDVAETVVQALDAPHPHPAWTVDVSAGYAEAIAALHDH